MKRCLLKHFPRFQTRSIAIHTTYALHASQNQQTHVGLEVYLVQCSPCVLKHTSQVCHVSIISSMDSGKKSWKLDLMSSTQDITYRVGPGIILLMFSTLALPPLSWEEEYQSKLPPLDGNVTSGASSSRASYFGASSSFDWSVS